MPAVIPLVAAAATAYAAKSAAGANASAAQNIAGQDLAATAPYNLNSGPFGSTGASSTGSGNQAWSSLSPAYGSLEQGLLGSSGGWLAGLDAAGATNGVSPLLANAYSQYQNSLPNASGAGFNSLYGQAFGNGGPANAFNGAATGLLGALGNYNPNAAGQNYTNLLASQTAPGNALAAQNLTQQLFNSGALGSTGGANALGALNQGQSQQYVAQQLAGQQLGMQNQSLLGSLAGQFGGLGTQMTANNFNMGSSLNNMLYGRQYNANQQGFQNTIGLNQAGLQNLGTYGSLAQGLLGSGMGIDNALLNQLQVSSNMGAARTGAVNVAGSMNLAGQLANNNMGAMTNMGLINGLSNVNWGGLFGGGNTTSPYAGNLNMVPSLS